MNAPSWAGFGVPLHPAKARFRPCAYVLLHDGFSAERLQNPES